MTTVLLAVPDVEQEPGLVAAASRCGVRVSRRCVDAVDLFAAAAGDPGPAIVVSAGLPRLTRDAIERIARVPGRRLVGLADDPGSAGRLRELGVRDVVASGSTVEATWRALAAAIASAGSPTPRPDEATERGVWAADRWADDRPRRERRPVGDARPRAADGPGPRAGRIIVVWGPTGAPGRTTVAMGVAEALADSGARVGLVDADTYGPSVAMALGIHDDAGGLVAACRHADNGSLGEASLLSASRQIRGGWHVLGGVGRPDRWPDLRQAALERVWATCRATFDTTVVDVGFCLENDEGDDLAAWARRRNVSTVTALAAADHVVAVAHASPLGAARLATAWPALGPLSTSAALTVVPNRVGRRGRGAARTWGDALGDLGVRAPIHPLPSDPKAVSACWAHGRSLAEGAPRSALRRSLVELAAALVSG